jgi:long-subunit fatty acid transport protein
MSARRFRLGIIALICLIPLTGRTGGFSNADFGVRRMGMFAVVGYPDDLTALFHNPAGLVLSPGTNFYHSQSWFFSELAFRMYDNEGILRPDHEIEPDWSIGAIPFLGFSTDFGVDWLRVGTAIYSPNAYGAVLPNDEPTRYHVTRALFLASRWTTSAAVRISPKFSAGLSINMIHVYLTASRVMNLSVLSNPDVRFLSPEETSAGDMDLTIDGQDLTWSWDLGFLFEPIPSLHIGTSFAAGSAVSLEGGVRLKYADGTVERARHTTTMAIPFTLRAGFNWEFVTDFQVAMDVRMWHYQVFQEQYTRLSEPITAAQITEFRDPKNYKQSFNWCIGLLYKMTPNFDVMMGFQQDFTPIPEETFTLDNPSRDQMGVSLGLRWQVNPSWRLGLAFVRNWFELVDIQKSISTPPSNAKGHGANSEVGFDLQFTL